MMVVATSFTGHMSKLLNLHQEVLVRFKVNRRKIISQYLKVALDKMRRPRNIRKK